MLGSTLERVRLADDLVARLEGKSSLGRLGLLIHSTAGFIDPGWDGHVTLELSNVANLPITIYHGMKIGQISFMQMTEPARAPVRLGRRSARSTRGSAGPTPSRYWKNFAAEARMEILVTGGTGFVGPRIVHPNGVDAPHGTRCHVAARIRAGDAAERRRERRLDARLGRGSFRGERNGD